MILAVIIHCYRICLFVDICKERNNAGKLRHMSVDRLILPPFLWNKGTNLIRAIPSAMTTMLTYEFLQRSIHNLKDGGEEQLRKEGLSV